MAQDLIAFTQGLVLDADLASAEPKRLRYALLHTAGRLSTTSRKTTLRLQSEWPWARALADAFATPFIATDYLNKVVAEDGPAPAERPLTPSNRMTGSLLMPTRGRQSELRIPVLTPRDNTVSVPRQRSISDQLGS